MGSLFYGGIKGKMVRTIVEVLLLEVFIALGIHNRAQKLCQMVTNWTEIYLFIYLFCIRITSVCCDKLVLLGGWVIQTDSCALFLFVMDSHEEFLPLEDLTLIRWN